MNPLPYLLIFIVLGALIIPAAYGPDTARLETGWRVFFVAAIIVIIIARPWRNGPREKREKRRPK